MMELVKFIKANADWETKLTSAPYNITVKRDVMFGHNLVMFSYSQIDSDFSDPIVQECRGVILDEDTLEVVSRGYDKFFNYGEYNAAKLNWSKVYTQQKIDGSIVKVSKYKGNVLISTNGCIDAAKAPIGDIGQLYGFNSFKDLFLAAVDKVFGKEGFTREDFYSFIPDGFTVIFELVSPYTQIVVKWDDMDIYLTGLRENATGEETRVEGSTYIYFVKRPEEFPLNSLNDCVKAAEALPENTEGFVIVDENFKRIKIKSPRYVALHHLKESACGSLRAMLEVVKAGELDEVLNYFPEFKDVLVDMNEKFTGLLKELEDKWVRCSSQFTEGMTRKDKAMLIMREAGCDASFIFARMDGKIGSAREWFDSKVADYTLTRLGFKQQG